jgi:hypothetical protein
MAHISDARLTRQIATNLRPTEMSPTTPVHANEADGLGTGRCCSFSLPLHHEQLEKQASRHLSASWFYLSARISRLEKNLFISSAYTSSKLLHLYSQGCWLCFATMAQTVAVNTFPGVPALTPAITYTAAGVHTNLTTIFTPPAGCWNGAWTLNTSYLGTMACTKAHTSSCFPSEFTGLASVLYSPAACPEGYIPGGMFTNTYRTNRTSCICCPR